jgi:hypothetical protein
MRQILLAAAVIAWASSAQANAVQCTITTTRSSPGPKELASFNAFGATTAKATLAIAMKPTVMDTVIEFRPFDGTAIASILDIDGDASISGAGERMNVTMSSLAYTVSRTDPSKPHDFYSISINRQTGALKETSALHFDLYDETVIYDGTGQCHAVTVPEPKL